MLHNLKIQKPKKSNANPVKKNCIKIEIVELLKVIPAFFDQSGSLVMGPRTGTPMRLVSPAPVLAVPPGAARAGPPPPQGPQMYQPQPQTAQQNLYSQQNGSSVGGKP